MLLKRFYNDNLAQASYLVGCAATGEAIVIDPNRDIDQYIRAATVEGMRITRVTETHIHADFVSGSRELAKRSAALLMLSDEGDAQWKYEFATGDGATLLHSGDTFTVGNLRFDVLHTPGHTPEHVSFLVTDTLATDQPMGAFTGDFVFVGDVGRTDLLERAAGFEGTMEAGARTLFGSLQRFSRLPDFLQLWPGHGAGSACGKSLGAVPSSTLGYEKIANWGLTAANEEAFVKAVLAGQPEPPRYFAEMKRINKEGPRILGEVRRPARLPHARLASLLAESAFVIDTRPSEQYAARNIAGTINIPLGKSFTTWAGWLTPFDRDVFLIVDDTEGVAVEDAVRDLRMIGIDRVAGYLGADVMDAWVAGGGELGSIPQITATELAARRAGSHLAVLDVRGRSEWETGHLPDVENIPVGHLVERLAELPRDCPLVVHCQGGARSAIAASLLRAQGMTNVINLSGGFAEWQAGGHPVENEVARA